MVKNPTDASATLLADIALPSGAALDPDSGYESVSAPTCVAVVDGKVFVGLGNRDAYGNHPRVPGLIAVIDPNTDTVEAVITLNYRNPVRLLHSSVHPHALFVLETGDVYYDGMNPPDNEAMLEVIDTQTYQSLATQLVNWELPPNGGAMGPDGRLYVQSGPMWLLRLDGRGG